jgi:hypothetical protein
MHVARPSFDEFVDMLDRAVDRIPPHFCTDLSGGFNVQQGKKREDGYYIMGEYVEGDHLGCFIVFYYGSFVAVLGDDPLKAWEEEIIDTVLHEMQHHLESMAGRDDLARQEIAELENALRSK